MEDPLLAEKKERKKKVLVIQVMLILGKRRREDAFDSCGSPLSPRTGFLELSSEELLDDAVHMVDNDCSAEGRV